LKKNNGEMTPEIEEKIKEYMRTWLMIYTAAKTYEGSLLRSLSKKKRINEMENYLSALDLKRDDNSSASYPYGDWKAFALTYFELCMSSKQYGSTVLGLLPLDDESTLNKLRKEITMVTDSYPRELGLEDEILPFRNTVATAFLEHFGEPL